jgi:hypothetical protein
MSISPLTNLPLMRAAHLRTALRFLVMGLLLQTVARMVLEFGDLNWYAYIYNHQGQPTVAQNLVASFASGLLDTLLFSEFWLIVASLLVWQTSSVFGRVPFWTVIIASIICVACYVGQRWLVWPPDDSSDTAVWQVMVLKEAATVPLVLIGCWWWNKRAEVGADPT